MTLGFTFDCGLAALAVIVAGSVVVTRTSFAAVIGFVTLGLLLMLVWVRLDAVDVAMTEAAIGSGLTGALLIGAAARLRAGKVPTEAEHSGPVLRVAVALLSIAVAVALAAAVVLLPDPAPTLAPAAAENAAATGLNNPVTNVLMAFRAMDTLLEKVVLLLALIGVWSLGIDRVWGGRPVPLRLPGPDGALALFAQLLPPLGIVVGIYILWEGANHPGGAFQGATILAAMWLLVMMTGFTDAPPVSSRSLRRVLIAGPTVFVAVGLGGLFLGDAFLAYPATYAKPLILIIEFAMTATVAATLGMLLAGPPAKETPR